MSLDDLQDIQTNAAAELAQAGDSATLEVWHRQYLGSSGQVTKAKSQIGTLPKEQRRDVGKAVNLAAVELQKAYQDRIEQIKLEELKRRIEAERIDVTLPPRPHRVGRYHPVTLVLREIVQAFRDMGFDVYDSPHVELDEYNFKLLNMPEHHPARDMQDTYYVTDQTVLRTHTSAGQVRAMRERAPEPIRIILPGLCYRHETISARSEIQFHQVEGLAVGEQIRMSDLKGILVQFARKVFGGQQGVRFRGSYFPFTEPSVEIDIKCTLCEGAGCRVCKSTGWLELLGAGMVHPVVLENGGYDPAKVRGIAFGLGIERAVMLRYGISDIRYFFQNDLRFLEQFA